MIRARRCPGLQPLPPWLPVIAVCVFLIMASLATAYRTIPGDVAIIRAVQKVPGPPSSVVTSSSNLLGDSLTSSLVILGLLGLSIVRRFVQGGIFCLTLIICWIAATFLKPLFDSPRPSSEEALVRDHFSGFGFPSGHAVAATVVAGAVTIMLPALFRVTPTLRIVVSLAWLWAVVCMFSRIWLGAHWFTDVVGGFAIGVAMVWLSAWISCRYWLARYQASPPTSPNKAP